MVSEVAEATPSSCPDANSMHHFSKTFQDPMNGAPALPGCTPNVPVAASDTAGWDSDVFQGAGERNESRNLTSY